MWVFKHRRSIIFIFLLLTAVSVHFTSKLRFNPDISKHLTEDNLDLENLPVFSDGEDVIYVGVYTKKGILRKPFLDSLHKVSMAIRRVPHVKGTLSISTLKDIEKSAFAYLPYRVISRKQKSFTKADSISIKSDPRIYGWLVSKDFKGALIVIETDASSLTEEEKAVLISGIESELQYFQSAETHLSGVAFIETSFLQMLKKWGPFGFIVSTIAVVFSLIFIYRSRQGVLVPIGSVLIGMALFYGYLGAMGRTLNVLSVLFPSILLIVGVSDIVHFTRKYQELLLAGENKIQALFKTLKELRIILFLTSFTTMIGFASFIRLPISIYQYFGLDTVVGIGIVFIVTIIFVPALLYDLPLPAKSKKQFLFRKTLKRVDFITSNYPNTIIVTWVILLLVAIAGIFRINTNNKIADRFSENSEPYQSIQFFEQHFAGTRYVDVRVQIAGNKSFKSISVLQELDKIHQQIYNADSIDNVFSPITMYKSINKANHGRDMRFYELPANQNQMDEITRVLEKNDLAPTFSFISKDFKTVRLSFLLPDIGRQEAIQFKRNFYNWTAHNVNSDLEVQMTGYNERSDYSTALMIESMFKSFGWALLVIALVIALLHKSVKMAVICIIPNLLPLLLVGGFVGYSGIALDSSIVLIFTISFVIVIDDTIHMLAKYKLEIAKSMTKKEAITNTILNTGPPVILTSIILFFCFGVLLLSPFKEAYLSGLLAPITVFLAVLSDLFLLPAMLQKFKK